MKKYHILFVLLFAFPLCVAAQNDAVAVRHEEGANFDISTNLFDWADLGTVNLDFGYAFARHFSAQVGVKFNPWSFKTQGPITLVQNQQKSASLGVRYWPWYVFSGWWVCAKAQYCDYAETGIWRPEYDSGKAVGGGLSAGYTLLISKNFNIEFGAGFWGGKLLEHTLANCPDPDCMDNPRESGPKNFIALNDLNISLHWVF